MTGLMEGKRGLIMGLANDKSLAWGIAKKLHAEGAELALSSMIGRERMLEKALAKTVIDKDSGEVIAEANAETDFVTQNDRFKHFIHDCVKQALETKPKSLADFLQQPYFKDKSITIP